MYSSVLQDAVSTCLLLIESGADLDAANCDGNTPLHAAYRNNMHNIVKILEEKGADQKIINKYGYTPFSAREKKGHTLLKGERIPFR